MSKSEQRVRLLLGEEFGKYFTERKLPIRLNLDGEAAFKKFDAVSEDGKVVAMVKDYSARNKVGNRTRLARVMQDLVSLHQVKTDRKFMYLSSEFLAWFRKTGDAVVPNGIEVRDF